MFAGGLAITDRCHVAALRHPPRDRFVDAEHKDGFVEMDALDWRGALLKDAAGMRHGGKIPSLEELEEEVRRNGFGDDLRCPTGALLRDIAKEKLVHPRHKALVSNDNTELSKESNMPRRDILSHHP